jgi:hypothetical protein
MDIISAIDVRHSDTKIDYILNSLENEYPGCIKWFHDHVGDVIFDLVLDEDHNCTVNIVMTPERKIEFNLKFG